MRTHVILHVRTLLTTDTDTHTQTYRQTDTQRHADRYTWTDTETYSAAVVVWWVVCQCTDRVV